MICRANQLTGFYTMAILTFNELRVTQTLDVLISFKKKFSDVGQSTGQSVRALKKITFFIQACQPLNAFCKATMLGWSLYFLVMSETKCPLYILMLISGLQCSIFKYWQCLWTEFLRVLTGDFSFFSFSTNFILVWFMTLLDISELIKRLYYHRHFLHFDFHSIGFCLSW